MFIPTPQQQTIIDHFNDHGIVIAGPGSGKTVTIIAHVKELILEEEVLPENIWVMAFNRDISLKLKEKIHRELGDKSPQVTTIHSFILIQTLAYGAQLLEGYEIAEQLGEHGKKKLIWEPLTAIIKEKHGITKTSEGKRLDIRHIKGILWNQLRDYCSLLKSQMI